MGNPKGHLVHGLHTHPLNAVWHTMKQRCENPNSRGFKWYGAKGISVCVAWQDFKTFYDWAISSGYEKGLTIERKVPAGDYEPDNCIWLPLSEQQSNKTNTRYLTVDGETHSITEWSKLTGIPRSTLSNRVNLLGLSPEEALFPGDRRTGKQIRIGGATCG